MALPQVGPPWRIAAWRHTMLAQWANVILWTTCLLAALIIYVAASGNVRADMVVYWWVAAAVIGLMGVAAHCVLTRDR